MKKNKIIFSILTILIIFISSASVYHCYDVVETSNGKSINFTSNKILYDILDNVYAISFQLDNVGKKEGIPKYLTANEDIWESPIFYQHYLVGN